MSKTKTTGKNRQAILKARTRASSKAARLDPVPANTKHIPGAKLTSLQLAQLVHAGRDIAGNPIDIEVRMDEMAVPTRETMSMIEFDQLKEEARKKKRGFKKFAESKGWEFTGSGDFKESHQDWTREAQA